MQHNTKTNSRKKFLLWGAAALSSFTIFRFMTGKKEAAPEPYSETVKMLTEDGRLVEIDKDILAGNGKKISNDELQQWIKK